MQQGSGLSNIQRELLKMFSQDLPDSQIREIKELLSKYFEEKVNSEMDQLWDQQGWSDVKMDSWAKDHMRKKR